MNILHIKYAAEVARLGSLNSPCKAGGQLYAAFIGLLRQTVA